MILRFLASKLSIQISGCVEDTCPEQAETGASAKNASTTARPIPPAGLGRRASA